MFMNQGVDNVMDDIAWSIYSFFNILRRYVIFGAVQVISTIFSLAVDYVVGRIVDLKGRKAMQFGGLANVILWIFRFFAKTNLQVYAINSWRGITGEFTGTSFNATSYEMANQSRIVPFIVFREICIQMGKLVALFSLLMMPDVRYSFILGIAYSLVYVFVRF